MRNRLKFLLAFFGLIIAPASQASAGFWTACNTSVCILYFCSGTAVTSCFEVKRVRR